jgi:hypothetical protein
MRGLDRSPACRGGRSGLIVDLNSIELAVSLRFVGYPPHPRGVSSRHVAGDPVNVRAPDRDVKGSPATPKFSPLHAARAANSGECHNPGMGTAPTGHNFTAWTHSASHPSGVPRRWRRRFLTGRHRQHCPMTAGSHLPGALVHRRPGRSPDRRRTRTAQAPAIGAGPFTR